MSLAWQAILALLLTSILVRIIPSFINYKYPDQFEFIIIEALPFAVFINFICYIIYIEISTNFIPAISSLTISLYFILSEKAGLITTTLIASIMFFLVNSLG